VSLMALLIACAAVVVFVLIAYARRWRWTGFVAPATAEQRASAPSQFAHKTLWDWLQLLIVPLVLAFAAFALNDAQDRRNEENEKLRDARERAIALDARRQQTLADYLQRMSDLVLEHGPGASRAGSRPFALARTLTVTVLGQLDPGRKRIVVQFLAETKLMRRVPGSPDEGPHLLAGADLRGAHLNELTLDGMSLAEADLRKANLDRAFLERANFYSAKLGDATFRNAFIDDTFFGYADLRGADLSSAAPAFDESPDFRFACVSDARFHKANLIGADFRGAAGSNVDFTGAELDRARLDFSELTAVKLHAATTRKTRFPEEWRPNGVPMSRAERKRLCEHLEWWRRG
jgi:hypothetical protein